MVTVTEWRRHTLRGAYLAVAGICAVAPVWPALQSGIFTGSPYADWQAPLAVALPLGTLAGAAAVLRSRQPVLMTAAALVAWAVTGAYPAIVVAQYNLGAHLSSRRAQVALTALTLGVVGLPLWRIGGADASAPLSVVVCGAPLVAGLYITSRREAMDGLTERLRGHDREQRLRIEQARTEERSRIARDMHDVVTHRVALMVLHATALEKTQGLETAEVARRIQLVGRAALDELRSLVGVLRDGEDPPMAPQPGLPELSGLVADSRALGIDTLLRIDTDIVAPALIGHTAYRVVQESLTNVHKHAPDARAEVTVTNAEGELILVVRNSAATALHPPPVPSGHHGLVGIRERVRLVGGVLSSRPLLDGGFEVTARLPLPTSLSTTEGRSA